MLAYLMAAPMPKEGDLAEIALALRRRDVDALAALVEQYHYRLTRYLIYVLGRRDGVDDLVQETWLRVLERGATFDGRARFEPWLFTIARNLAIDTQRRRSAVSLDSSSTGPADADLPSPGIDIPSDAPSPFLAAARSEDASRLAHALQTLEQATREVLVLRFQEDLSLAEIAAVIAAPVSTVSSRIYRGLAALRTELEGSTS